MVTATFGQAVNTPTSAKSSQVVAPQLPADTEFRVTDRGANHRIWQRETYEMSPSGQVVPRIHKYAELATGMHYQDANGQWVESQEKIEAFSGGAVARHGQHQVIFANNLNSQGSIDMQTPDGKRLRSNILGVMYVDTATGDAVVIARLQDSEGQLISDNQVLYPNAFEGVKADVQYTYRREGFEQDVILREQPPTPESFGMDSATTELEVFTEFINPPAASVKDSNDDNGLEADQEIGWGDVMLGRGKAFNLGDQTTPAPVAKRYVKIQGRYFLLEKVPVEDIQQDVVKLPEQAANPVKLPVMAFNRLTLPKTPLARSGASPMRLASSALPDKGYVLDYVTINSDQTGYTFQGDTTYYISGTVALYGTNTFEGGAVLKFATNGVVTMHPGGSGLLGINWPAVAYRPVIFTAKDDNTVGENISGSTGNPTGYYGNPMLTLATFSPQTALTDLRISYANTAVGCYSGNFKFNDVQVVNCQNGFSLGSANVSLGNALFANTKTNIIFQGGSTLTAQNATFSGSSILATAPSSPNGSYLALTNCVLANVTNLVSGSLVTTNGNFNGFYQSPVFGINFVTNAFFPFQTVGGGSYYLTNGCNFLNVGTTNISPTVLADLKMKTTCPPIVYSNTTVSIATTFSPQAQRDTDIPDLGYHYDPIDYIFGGVQINSNVTVTAGTSVAWFELTGSHSGNAYGLNLNNGVSVTFNGTATLPCTFVTYNSVQEVSKNVWEPVSGWPGGIADGGSYDPNNPSVLNACFTRFAALAGQTGYFRDGTSGQPLVIRATDCELRGTWGGYNILGSFTNCLWDRVNFWQGTSSTYPYEILRNCTLHGGSFDIVHWESGAPYWYSSVYNCAFDNVSISIDDPFGVNTNYADYNFNAFAQGANQLNPEGTNNVTVTKYNWQSSWLGNYYQPTNSPLINKGSTTADLVGFYHFTTQTNQVKETNSIVDIGYHYVATDAYGNPIDTDGDGTPDYLEDANGNGIFDAGDLGNWLISPFNGLSTANGLSVFTPLK